MSSKCVFLPVCQIKVMNELIILRVIFVVVVFITDYIWGWFIRDQIDNIQNEKNFTK